MPAPEPAIQHKVSDILGFRPDVWTPVRRGYTPARRYIVRGDKGAAFVKIAATPLTARLLTREIAVYRTLDAPFMPRLLGWDDDAATPILVIEDLSAATWPPPWTGDLAARVIDQMRAMHRTPSTLERRTLLHTGREAGWPTVAADPGAFLSLGLVSHDWLDAALPALIDAERRCPLDGDATTHLDLRSDNICIADGVVKFIDWAEAGIGSAEVDLAFFLPSLAFEGGPLPETVLPDAPEMSALVSGFFAARAGLPVIPDAPFVRRVQHEQLTEALPWAQRALGLPPLDGQGAASSP